MQSSNTDQPYKVFSLNSRRKLTMPPRHMQQQVQTTKISSYDDRQSALKSNIDKHKSNNTTTDLKNSIKRLDLYGPHLPKIIKSKDAAALSKNEFLTPLLHHPNDLPKKLAWEDHTIEISDDKTNKISITMEDFVTAIEPKRELPVTLVTSNKKISTHVFKGIMVRDLLLQKGIIKELSSSSKSLRQMNKKFIQFIGDNGSECYISMARILNPAYDIILAYEANGELLSHDNGFPIRLIVPGYTEAYSIKCIKTINIVCNKEGTTAIKNANPALNTYKEVNMNSVITNPVHNETIDIAKMYTNSYNNIEGYAYAGGGRKITRVEISTDKGITWNLAKIHPKEQCNDYDMYWCWIQWSYNNIMPVIHMITMKEIWVRAWDESNNVQNNDYVYKVKIHLMKDSNASATIATTNHMTSSMKKYLLNFEHSAVDGCKNDHVDSLNDDYGFLS